MRAAATRLTANAAVAWGGENVKVTVDVPAGTGICWKSPAGPEVACSTRTADPFTVAVHPGMYWTRRSSTEGRRQRTVAWSHPWATTVQPGAGPVTAPVDPPEAVPVATACSENAGAAVGSCQISAKPSR